MTALTFSLYSRMDESEPVVIARYSIVTAPLFLFTLFAMGLGLRIMGQDAGNIWLEMTGYALWLGGAAFLFHIFVRRGRAVQVRDGKLIYGFLPRRRESFSEIADITVKTYNAQPVDVEVVMVWKWDGSVVRLITSLMKGSTETIAARLRAAVGLPETAATSDRT